MVGDACGVCAARHTLRGVQVEGRLAPTSGGGAMGGALAHGLVDLIDGFGEVLRVLIAP